DRAGWRVFGCREKSGSLGVEPVDRALVQSDRRITDVARDGLDGTACRSDAHDDVSHASVGAGRGIKPPPTIEEGVRVARAGGELADLRPRSTRCREKSGGGCKIHLLSVDGDPARRAVERSETRSTFPRDARQSTTCTMSLRDEDISRRHRNV